MLSRIRCLWFAVLILSLPGFIHSQSVENQSEPETPRPGGFLYGRITRPDMREGSCRLERISIIRFENDRVGERFWAFVLTGGYYYFRDLKPGIYQISSLSLPCKGPSAISYFDDRKPNLYQVNVDRGGVFYLGDRIFISSRDRGFTLPLTRSNSNPNQTKQILCNLLKLSGDALKDIRSWLYDHCETPATTPAQ